MSTGIKQFKTVQSGEFLGNMISKLDIEAMTKFIVSLTNDIIIIIRIITSLETSVLLIDRVTETVKVEIKKQEHRVLASLMAPEAASLIAPAASSLLGGIFEKGVMEIEKKDKKTEFCRY